MNRRWLFICSMICVYMGGVHAQESLMKQKNKIVNWGMKAGMNAVLPDIESIHIYGVQVGNINVVNDVGYSVELLGRINIARLFLQPSVVWKYARGNIRFDLTHPPLAETDEPFVENHAVAMKIYSLEAPFVVGFNVVKEKPYVLSVMAGTKFKYNYKTDYRSERYSLSYQRMDDPYDLSVYAAFEVVIGKLTFDFGYEYGINSMNVDFESVNNVSGRDMVKMKKRLDGINMSIGILF